MTQYGLGPELAASAGNGRAYDDLAAGDTKQLSKGEDTGLADFRSGSAAAAHANQPCTGSHAEPLESQDAAALGDGHAEGSGKGEMAPPLRRQLQFR